MFKKTFLLFLLMFINLVNAKTIILDVGHNDKQPGSRSSYGSYEFFYNQAFVRDLAISMNKDYALQFSGLDGKAYSLEKRTDNTKNSDFFISIHHDSIQPQDLQKWTFNNMEESFNDDIYGFSIFVSSKNPFFQQSLNCANILAQKLVKNGFKPNFYHASNIHNENKPILSKNGVFQYDNLIVLKSSKSPAMLIEVGVITNRSEALNVLKDDFKNNFINSIKLSLDKCLN